MKQVLSQSIVSGGNRSVFTDYALEFNGTDEYLTRALPTNLLTGTTSDFTSAGTRPTGWGTGSGETWNQTGITGSTSTNVLKLTGTNAYAVYGGLTAGKKYKIRVRWYGDNSLRIGSTSTGAEYYTSAATTQWNRKEITLVATSANLYFSIASGTVYIDFFNFTEDWKLDLNESYELIKHSMNRDFEQTLGTELNSGTVTIGKKYIVTAGTVEGNAVGTEFLAVTATTTLDASNKVREIPNLVTNGTFESNITGYSHVNGDISWDATGKYLIIKGVNAIGGTTRLVNNSIVFPAGKRFKLTFYAKSPTLTSTLHGTLRLRSLNGTLTLNPVLTTSFQRYEGEVVAGSDTGTYLEMWVKYEMSSADEVHFDNIHIYELPDYTSTGNHSFTYSTVDKYAGTGSLKITAGGAGNSSNCVTLPSANLESCVSGKKYTLQGEARLDASSLSYGTSLATSFDMETDPVLADGGYGATYTMVADERTGGSGTQSLEMTRGSSSSTTKYRAISTGLSVGDIVKITCWIKNIDATSGQIFVFDGTNVSLSNAVTSTSWTQITHYARYTGGTFNLWFMVNGTIGQKVRFDDVVITKTTSVAPTITAQLGTKSVTSSALSIVSGTFTKFVLNFEWQPADVTAGQDLKLYLSGAGSVFVDAISLTQAYDMWISNKAKVTDALTYRGIFGVQSATSDRYAIFTDGGTGRFRCDVSHGTTSVVQVDSAINISDNKYYNLGFLLNRTGNAQSFLDGTLLVTQAMTVKIGKFLLTQALQVGSMWADKMKGQISHLQIIRFENISQSSFNSAITGLQYPTGGGAEEVLRLTFQSGVSITECLKDYSPMNHTVSGVNVDITNRKRVTI